MIDLRLGHPSDFPFVDKPQPRNVKDGFETLLELGAITGKGRDFTLTPLGRRMAPMPLDPRISRMLLKAAEEGCLREVAVIASALSIRDPRERPPDQTAAADAKHAFFKHPDSDFLSLLNIWDAYRRVHEEIGLPEQAQEILRRELPLLPEDAGVGLRPRPDPVHPRGTEDPAGPPREARDVRGAIRGDPPVRPERLPLQHRRPQGKEHLHGGQGPGGHDLSGLDPLREGAALDRRRRDGPDIAPLSPGRRRGSIRIGSKSWAEACAAIPIPIRTGTRNGARSRPRKK